MPDDNAPNAPAQIAFNIERMVADHVPGALTALEAEAEMLVLRLLAVERQITRLRLVERFVKER